MVEPSPILKPALDRSDEVTVQPLCHSERVTSVTPVQEYV
jgi:hypothetical protein